MFDINDEQRLLFSKEKIVVAKKDHECCECGEVIQKGQKYAYFFGVWEEEWNYKFCCAYKTCLSCEKDWEEVLDLNETGYAVRAYGKLKDAIEEEFELDLLIGEHHHLAEEWLGAEPEMNTAELTPEEIKEHEKTREISQIRETNYPFPFV